MSDDPLDYLRAIPNLASLEGIEGEVWQRIAVRERSQRSLGRLASVQLAVLVLTVAASVMGGSLVSSRAVAETSLLGVFSPNTALSPSARLLGHG